jgi:hypothetical protein
MAGTFAAVVAALENTLALGLAREVSGLLSFFRNLATRHFAGLEPICRISFGRNLQKKINQGHP